MKNIILFGPPGSGKGTQAEMLEEKFNLLHISTGDLFRSEIKEETRLGKLAKNYIDKGELVPDEVTVGMLQKKIDQNKDVKGYIFDGFPRTLDQAEALDELLKERNTTIFKLLALKVTDEEIVKRIKERGKDSGRSDDLNENVILKRIHVYENNTKPVYEFYDDRGKAESIDGMGSIDEIHERLVASIVEEEE